MTQHPRGRFPKLPTGVIVAASRVVSAGAPAEEFALLRLQSIWNLLHVDPQRLSGRCSVLSQFSESVLLRFEFTDISPETRIREVITHWRPALDEFPRLSPRH